MRTPDPFWIHLPKAETASSHSAQNPLSRRACTARASPTLAGMVALCRQCRCAAVLRGLQVGGFRVKGTHLTAALLRPAA